MVKKLRNDDITIVKSDRIGLSTLEVCAFRSSTTLMATRHRDGRTPRGARVYYMRLMLSKGQR